MLFFLNLVNKDINSTLIKECLLLLSPFYVKTGFLKGKKRVKKDELFLYYDLILIPGVRFNFYP